MADYYIGEDLATATSCRGMPMQDLPTPFLQLGASSLSLDSRRHLPRTSETVTGRERLQVTWARDEDALRDAQRLRYRVFSEEMGARLSGPAGLDVDAFDAYCDQ